MNAAIIETAHVAAGHAEINAADFHVGHLLGLNDGVADVLLDGGRVADFAFADAARFGLAQADDVQSGRIGIHFADNRADFRRADFPPDDDAGGIKHFFSWCVEVLWFWERAAP